VNVKSSAMMPRQPDVSSVIVPMVRPVPVADGGGSSD
jgi:hypothetical protein